MEDLVPYVNGLAGVASMVIAVFLYPTLKALRALVEQHAERLDDHGERIAKVEGTLITPKRIRRRSR